jgi:hypothetical protein
MKNALLRGLILICLLSGCSCAYPAETPDSKALSAVAPKVIFLCDFATFFQLTPKLQSSWKALADPSLDTHNLTLLLKRPDPKIRSLAIFALDRKNDPHILSEIAVLQSDGTPSYPCPLPVAQPVPPDKPAAVPRSPRP